MPFDNERDVGVWVLEQAIQNVKDEIEALQHELLQLREELFNLNS